MLKAFGRGIVYALWLFNAFALRLVVALEAFVFLVGLPFVRHLGPLPPTDGKPHFVAGLLLLVGVPVVNTLLALVLSHGVKPGAGSRLFALFAFAVNALYMLSIAHYFPEGVRAEPAYVLVASAIMTAATFFSRWLFRRSFIGQLPSETEQPSS